MEIELLPRSPEMVLLEDYIKPSNKSLRQYAMAMRVSRTRLEGVVNGNRKMTPEFIDKLCRFTRTVPAYWYNLQIDFDYADFTTQQRKKISPIESRLVKTQSEANPVARFLKSEFIDPTGCTPSSIDMQIGEYPGFMKTLLTGQKVTHYLAGKLASAFSTSAKFWIDLQTQKDALDLINSDQIRNPKILDELKVIARKRKPDLGSMVKHNTQLHPGKLLWREYVEPTNIPFINWCRLFRVPGKQLRPILNGTREIPLELIIKVSIVFGTPIKYWIEIQNNFYSTKAEAELAKRKKKVSKFEPVLKEQAPTPGRKLLQDYLTPAGWDLKDFAEHIGVKPSRLYSLTKGGVKIDLDLASRIGEALAMDAKFWLRLQLDYDLRKNRPHDISVHHN